MITVLYVDDEAGLLEIGKLFLEQAGEFKVRTVLSAEEALASPAIASFDAIVSDYQMPGMDGIAFLKAIRQRYGDLPFILFTGRGREEVVIEAINNGADFYLQKGGDPEAQYAELAHKVRQAVRRNRAERSLIDSERRLADIINFLPDATFAIDTGGVVIAWNLAMEKMTGVASSEILGKGNYEYVIPFYHERRPMLIDLVLNYDPASARRYPAITRKGTTLFSESTIPHFNNDEGADIWFTASPLYDTQGAVVGAIESIREITARKQAEEALRKSEERYRNIVEDQTEFISRFKPDGTHVFVNEAYCRYFGLKREEILGQRFRPRIASGDRERVREFFASLTPDHPVDIIEHRIIMPDGTVRWQRWSDRAIFDPSGTITEFQSVGRDITERKRNEEELFFKNVILSTQLETSPDGILIVDEGGMILMHNRRFVEIWRIPDGLMASGIDEPVLEYVTGNLADPEAFLSRVRYLYEHMEEESFEELLLKDGRLLERFSAPMLGEAGKYYGRVWHFRDITLRKQTEEILRKSQQQLEDAADLAGLVNWDYDPRKGILTFDNRFFSMVGTSADRESGNQIPVETYAREFVHPGDIHAVAEEMEKAVQSADLDYLSRREHRIVRRDGGVRHVITLIRVMRDADRQPIKVHGTLQDITEQKRLEAALRESEERLHIAFNGTALSER